MSKKLKIIIVLVAIVLVVGGAAIAYKALLGHYKPTNDSLSGNASASQAPEQAPSDSTEQPEKELVPAINFTVYDTEDNAVSLVDKIGKPIIVNFWASWCGPCKSEMADFQTAYDNYGDKVEFMMVNMTDGSRETVETAAKYIMDEGFTFPVYYDNDISAATAYGVSSIPATYVIDKDGNIYGYAVGPINEDVINRVLDELE